MPMILAQAPMPPAAVEHVVQPRRVIRAEQQAADRVLQKVRAALPRTNFVSAKPSAIPGFIALTMSNGQVAYTDHAARFFVIGLAFDLTTGKPIDNTLDGSAARLGPETELDD